MSVGCPSFKQVVNTACTHGSSSGLEVAALFLPKQEVSLGISLITVVNVAIKVTYLPLLGMLSTAECI